ncbi:hypothetical protein ACFX2I_044656 [Malus domestica]
MALGYLLHYVSNQRKRRETKAVEVRRAHTRFGRGRWLYVDSTDMIPQSGDGVGTCANATSRKRRDGIITYGTRLERADKFAKGSVYLTLCTSVPSFRIWICIEVPSI